MKLMQGIAVAAATALAVVAAPAAAAAGPREPDRAGLEKIVTAGAVGACATCSTTPRTAPARLRPDRPGDPPPLIDFTEMNPSVMGAGGSLISTTRDLNHFFHALPAGCSRPTC